MSRLIVKNHHPLQWSLSIIMLSMFVAFVTWLMLDVSHWSVIYDRMSDNQQHENLRELNRSLEQENIKLRERVLMLEQTESLDKRTAVLLQESLQSQQDKIYSLKGELEFYQGIMNDAGTSQGLNIHGIHIAALPQRQNYRLKLILTNVAKSVKVIEGTMDISFEGIQDGISRQLKLQDITLDETLELSFKFRNFKRFESRLELPSGFTPRRVFIQLQPKGRKQSKIKKVFDWQASAS